MSVTGITQKEVSFESLQQEIEASLNDPFLEKEDWKAVSCWGKARLVSLTNKALSMNDPRKKELLTRIDVFGVRHGYCLGIRLDSI